MLFHRKDDTVILQKTPQTEFVAVAYEGGKDIPIFERADCFVFYTVLKKRMMYDTGTEIDPNDDILILQTCSYKEEYSKYNKKFLLVISRRVK